MSNIKVDEYFREHLEKNEVENVVSDLCVMVFTDRTLADGRLIEMLKYIETSYPDVYEQLRKQSDETQYKRLSENGKLIIEDINEDAFADAVVALKNNFCLERIEDIKVLGQELYGKSEQKPKENDGKKIPKIQNEQKKPLDNNEGKPMGKSQRPAQAQEELVGLMKVAIVAAVLMISIIAINFLTIR